MIDYNEEWTETDINSKVRMKRLVKFYLAVVLAFCIAVLVAGFFR